MRVISGEYKGRKLKSIAGDNTRPTADKVKESIFNMIGPYFDDGECLDLFAGSGGLGIEAVSRGMSHAVLSEKNRHAVQTIKENITMTKEPERFTILMGDSRKNMLKLANKEPETIFKLVFIDPPYQAEKTAADIQLLIENGLIDNETVLVCEMDSKKSLPEEIAYYYKRKRVEYGAIAVEIFEAK